MGLAEDGTLQVQPEAILDVRFSADGDAEVLVKWLHLPACENSWDRFKTLQALFPALHLEDKVNF